MENNQPKTISRAGYATPKHVFLHLLMIAMLYVSVIAMITLYFQYINEIWFDAALGFNHMSIYDGIRWSSSALLVAYPVLVYITWLIQKEFRAAPELRQMRTRRWLLYLTQFITAITIIVDLMVLIYNFYGGEITSQFIAKVCVVLVIAAVVLGYYQWELHRHDEASKIPKLAAISAAVVLLVSIASGFWIAGTPAQQRGVRLDEQRVNDLMSMQNQIVNYVQTKGELPSDVAALTEWTGPLATDPATEADYIYSKTSETTFQLCAEFSSTLDEDIYQDYYGYTYPEKSVPQLIGGSSWKHPAGNYCFDRTVDLAATSN